MKKFFSLIALCAMVLVSCQKEADSVSVDKNSWKVAYTGGEYTVAVTANVPFEAKADQDWVTIVAGTDKVDFTVAENETTAARTATITFTAGEANATVTVEQEAAPNYVSLGEPANCFQVSEAGYYYFDGTVMGNGDAGLHSTFACKSTKLDPKAAKLVWEEVEGLVTGVALKDGKVQFQVANRDGNAVIAVTDASDNILWSWHIWSAEAPKDVALGAFTVMDRNLGAFATTGEDAFGVYYEWGRKDPFSRILGFDSGNGDGWYHPVVSHNDAAAEWDDINLHTVEYAIANPIIYIGASSRNADWLLEPNQRYLWGMNFEVDGLLDYPAFKTIYDPCPAGYEVATTNCFAAEQGSWSKDADATVYLDAAKKVIVPAAGFIYNRGFGWYDADGAGWAGLWSDSTAWGNVENAFRLQSTDDARSNYDRATGHPVRCMKIQ